MAALRYIVENVDAAAEFYTRQLGFKLVDQMGPPFAVVERDGLRLWLSGPGSSARRAMPNGRDPQPGGWNRLVIEVDDIDSAVARMRAAGVHFRNEIVSGPGGRQVVIDDPSGNPVEIFQPSA